MPKDYNNYFRLSVGKRVFMGTRRETLFQEETAQQLPAAYRHFFKKTAEVALFQSWLSPLLVMPGCHPSLSF